MSTFSGMLMFINESPVKSCIALIQSQSFYIIPFRANCATNGSKTVTVTARFVCYPSFARFSASSILLACRIMSDFKFTILSGKSIVSIIFGTRKY